MDDELQQVWDGKFVGDKFLLDFQKTFFKMS